MYAFVAYDYYLIVNCLYVLCLRRTKCTVVVVLLFVWSGNIAGSTLQGDMYKSKDMKKIKFLISYFYSSISKLSYAKIIS